MPISKNALLIVAVVGGVSLGLAAISIGPRSAPASPESSPGSSPATPILATPASTSTSETRTAPSKPVQRPSGRPNPAGQAPSPGQTGELATLTRVNEIRVLELGNTARSHFPSEQPGLRLTFVLNIPKGKKLIGVSQPTSIRASDSAGTDLANIEPGFSGKREHLDTVFGGDDRSIKLTLALPARQATSYSVELEAQASIFQGTRDADLAQAGGWTKLEAKVLGLACEYRITTTKGQGAQVDFRPEGVRDRIEGLTLVDGSSEIPSQGSVWGMGLASYHFPGTPTANAKLRVAVREGYQSIPITIKLDGLPLP